MAVRTPRLTLALLLVGFAACAPVPEPTAGPAIVDAPKRNEAVEPMPLAQDSLKFCVLGDAGTGDRAQYTLAAQMAKTHKAFPYEMCVLVGDNMYGDERPQDRERKFEIPYKPLLDAKVKFYAALGNHDERLQANYEHFNMEGKLYYTFKAPKQSVRFFALESTYPEPEQIQWLGEELKKSTDDWKIPFFHHPLYSSGQRHGSDLRLRASLEPLFVDHNVSVVFTGHDHFYERTTPQKGIPYFVVGSGGKLRAGNIDPRSGITARGYDAGYVFLIGEIRGDDLVFQAINQVGAVVDSGKIRRRIPPASLIPTPGGAR
jgi:hypothetical protein